MAGIDLSPINEALPLIGFLLVVVLIYGVLQKSKLFEHWFIQVFLAFLVALIFIVFVSAREYVQQIVPWAVVLIVCLFFLFLIIGFIGKDASFMTKGLGAFFVFLLLIGFLITAVRVFPDFFEQFYNSKWYTAVILVVVCGLVGWALVKLK